MKRLEAGFAFGAAALALSTLGTSLSMTTQYLLLLLGMLLTGIVHGAFDALIVAKRSGRTPGAAFYLIYVAAVLAMLALWWLAPLLGLLVFLLLSIHHFGAGDALTRLRWAEIFARGGALIVLSAAGQAQATAAIYDVLLRSDQGAQIVSWLASDLVVRLWAVGFLLALAALISKATALACLSALELCCLALAAWFAPPILAFAAFFCGSHALRHLQRTASELHPALGLKPALWQMLKDARLIVAGSLLSALGLLLLLAIDSQAWLLSSVFVGLAALTVPHAFFVDRPIKR